MQLNVLDLFSGIGGFSVGLEATGKFKTIGFCEQDKFCQKVLRKHWSDVPIYEDIKKLDARKIKADVVVGGFPCQSFSIAGKQKGKEDERYLWDEMFRVIKEVQPRWIIGENVQNLINIADGQILQGIHNDLESENYEVQTFNISASSQGAWHKRSRVWIVAANTNSGLSIGENQKIQTRGNTFDNGNSDMANSNIERLEGSNRSLSSEHERDKRRDSHEHSDEKIMANSSSERLERHRREHELREDSEEGKVSRSSEDVANSERIRQQGPGKPIGPSNTKTDSNGKTSWFDHGSEREEGWWDVEPNVGRVAHGISGRVHRLKGLGNSIVPQIAEEIGKALIKAEHEME